MKSKNKTVLFILLTLVFGNLFAQYEIKKYTINNGGSKTSGGQYELNASIGQTDATDKQTSGNYILTGGFWPSRNNSIFKNGFE